MMRLCYNKLSHNRLCLDFSVSNAMHLPYPSNYFDAIYSFGALGEFSNIQSALKEMTKFLVWVQELLSEMKVFLLVAEYSVFSHP